MGRKTENQDGAKPWYLSAQAVAERKQRSRDRLEKEGGRVLRDIRLDKSASDAFDLIQSEDPSMDNGAVVRAALLQMAAGLKQGVKRPGAGRRAGQRG